MSADEHGARLTLILDVLDVLLDRAGSLVLRDELMAAVWPATAVEDTNLNMQIAAIRLERSQKIHQFGEQLAALPQRWRNQQDQ